MKMTREELAAKLEAHTKWLNTRYTDHVEGECANLMGADLTGTNLMDANLTGANLMRANLMDANLTGADLTGAYLTRANLMDADLTGADLMDADLTDANLSGANLMGADLEHVWRASTLVLEAILATISARMALKKTRIEWEQRK